MNEELQKQLAALLASLMNVASDGAKWAGSQIPPLVQEKILYGRISHTAWAVLFAVVAWQAARVTAMFYRQACADRADRASKGFDPHIWPDRPGGLPSIGCGALVFIASCLAVLNLNDALLAWFAPRLYIVEWLRTLIN